MISKDKNKSNVTNRLQLPPGGNRTTTATSQPRYTHIAPRPIAPSQQGARQPLLQPKPTKSKQPSVRRTNKERKKPTTKITTATKTTASMPPPSTVPAVPSTNIVESRNNNPFVFDAEDEKFIQELLAGIPSGGATWLPPTDPLTSEGWFPDPTSSVITQDSFFQPPPTTTTDTATAGNLEAAAANANHKQTPDGRLMATVRSTTTKTTPLRSSSTSKRHNPLNGFAKKHGVGYPVGNQLALVSPALLSSSPPSARQLRQDPYKFYSPPQKQPKQQSSSSSSQPSTQQQGGEKKKQKDVATAANNNIKWEISQDKLLLRGVRQQRWLLDGKQYSPGALVDARDPSQFTTSDWERIARGVSAGAGQTRTGKQCRRRWAMIHMHLGTSIMDFVDSKPTPQSSTRTTPAANQVGGGPVASRNAGRNLRLAELPHSSPPIPRPPPAVTSKPPKEPEPKQTSEILVDGKLDVEKRWDMPLYCQLLADVVQAISDPQSQAAQVARKHGVGFPAEINESGKEVVESVLPIQPQQQQQQQQTIATPVIDNIDQDLNVYMQFLQSLTNDQLGNMDNNAWNTLFSDPATAMTTTAAIDTNTAPGPIATTASTSNKQTAAKGDEEDASDDDFILDEADLDEEDDDDDNEDEDEEERRKRANNMPAAATPAKNGWDLSLDKLMGGESTPSSSMNMLSPDPLIQQLMQNVADMGQGNDNQQSAWLPNATDPDIMAAASAGSTDLSSALAMGSTDKQRVPPSSTSKLQPTFSTIGMGSAVQRTASHPANTMMAMVETDSSADKQSSVQQPNDEAVTLKTPTSLGKKRSNKKKTAASSSIVQALSEAAMLEPSNTASGEIDTEMSGLYQDALQEGEVLDVQEEALVADSSEFLFLKEQMDQLRQQQLQNFQFVVQAFMIRSRGDDGPHSEQARYWKGQLDQLLLWDSQGTSPTSFFVIPGIRIVVPELYAAMDEMHRATMPIPKNDDKNKNKNRSSNQRRQEVVRSYVVTGGRVEVSEDCQCTVVDKLGCSMMTQRVLPELCAKIRYRNYHNLGSKKRKKSLPVPVAEEDAEVDDANIPPLTTPYTPAEEREAIENMRAEIRAFRKNVYRVPKPRRRILVQGEDGVPRLDWITVKVTPVVLPPAMQSILNMLVESQGCSQWLLPQIMVVRKPKNRIHFMDSEDALLLQGLRLFGFEDVASMRVHLMPAKTASQLRNRLSNLRARRAPPNAVKEFYLRRIQPFTLEEEEVLRVGILVYGDEFGQVNSNHQNFLINRPILALTNVLNHHVKKKSAAITDDKKSQQSLKK